MHTLYALWSLGRMTLLAVARVGKAPQPHDAESYLAHAVTLGDLESRERQWLQSL